MESQDLVQIFATAFTLQKRPVFAKCQEIKITGRNFDFFSLEPRLRPCRRDLSLGLHSCLIV